ncbi:MAG: membrane protein insertase YidC [Clostridia bacterium]|nr:membrane protein insertase YidC [Clostridia bacterium]
MGFISEIFGYVLNFLYQWIGSYGIAIMIFSVLLRLILLPITIKQQTTMKKSAALQEKTKQLQFKYRNDPERLNKETMQLYKDEKMSPFSGCLSGIIQIVIILAVFWLVSQPLTYMKRVNSDETLKNIYEGYKTEIEQSNGGNRVNYIEIGIIAKIEEEYKQTVNDIENYDSYVERINKINSEEKAEEVKENNDESEEINNEKVEEESEEQENTEVVSNEENKENEEKVKILSKEELIQKRDNLEKLRINMELFGLDLSKVPSQNMTDWTVYIIPGLYVITSFISIKMTTSAQKKKKKEKELKEVNENGEQKETDSQDELMDSMGQMSNTMLYMMPIMSISIAFIAPLGLALYWLVSNLLIILERVVLTKIMKSKEGDENE